MERIAIITHLQVNIYILFLSYRAILYDASFFLSLSLTSLGYYRIHTSSTKRSFIQKVVFTFVNVKG